MSYDQWKTASPYDDETDWQDEAAKFIEANANTTDRSLELSVEIMRGLLEWIGENA